MVKHGNQPCPKIAQCTVELQADSQSVFQDWYFEKTSGWLHGEMETLGLAVMGEFQSNLLPHFATDVTAIRVVATDLSSLASERAVVPFPLTPAGGTAGHSLPNNVAWSIQKQTGNRGKGRQGRIMWGPIPTSSVVQDTVQSAYADPVMIDIFAYITAVTGILGGIGHVVLSRWDNKVWRPAGIGIPVTSMGYTNLVVDSLKLRLPQHKRRRITTP